MKIEFVGGARTVTGSSFIIKDEDYSIMVDCGMFQGKRELRERNYLQTIYAPGKIDALILTHAHIDHSGLIPKLVSEGFYGNIYSTKATADLCRIMLPDSAHIQEMDAEYINRKNKKLGRDPIDPLYTMKDAECSLENFVPVAYGERVQIHPRIHIRFRDAGHIIGSSSVEIWIEENGKEVKLLFSGDIGSKDQAIIRDPELIDYADILFIESTYGDRLHKSKVDTYKEFKEIINDSFNRKGNIIIPSFAVGRTQEIIYTLGKLMRDEEIPAIPVYIDSPLAISATEIFRTNPECFDEETREILNSGDSPLNFPTLSFSRTADESKRLCQEAKGSIIISASGMCTAGRIKYHLMHNLYQKDSSVVFVGYQAKGTLGRRIIDGAQQVRVYGEDVKVNARIETLGGFSAHADREGLIDWMSSIDNDDLQVFVVHGEDDAALSFADTIQERFNYVTHIPVWGEIIDVDTMRSNMAGYGKEEGPDMVEHEIESLSRTLELLASRYRHARKENRIQDTRSLQDDINDTRELLAMLIDEL